MEFLVVYVLIVCIWASALVASYAQEKGRSAFGFFCIALFMSPLFAAVLLIAAPARQRMVMVPQPVHVPHVQAVAAEG